MKNVKRTNSVNDSERLDNGIIESKSIKRGLPKVSGWLSINSRKGVIAGILLAVGLAFVALTYMTRVTGANTEESFESSAQLGSPDFKNPNEVRSDPTKKRLRAVMQIISGNYKIPNVATQNLRQFRGWDAGEQPPADLHTGPIAPGPTLRARLGEQVQISFLNKIDDKQFPYTFVTDSKPGFSDFGCDQSGTRDQKTGLIYPYPANDKFPNCFHGSSTANIHFHGTHTSPDGLGDNVLLQLMPKADQTNELTKTFNDMFDSGKIPQEWADMPEDYRKLQQQLVTDYDPALWKKNQEMIHSGQWPQYLMGAFPNFFEIPDYASNKWKAGQAPGTHWYHAHKHGSTSLHILNGLAGAFVIESNAEGGYDHVIRKFYRWADSYGEHEKVIVFQQFDPNQNLQRNPTTQGKGIKQVLVNGLLTPTISMKPGEVQLWRMVNATVGNNPGKLQPTLFDTSAGFQFQQTAQDGVQFSPDNYKNQPFLKKGAPGGLPQASGNRADILVKATTKAGVYPFKSGNTTLFFVKVEGESVDAAYTPAFPSDWPEIPAYLKDLRPPEPTDITNPGSPVRFQWEAGRTGIGLNPAPGTTGPKLFPPHFMINNKQFGETGEVVDQCMPLDGLQDWVLENWTTTPHPFHIHINPFQVIKVETPTGFDFEYSSKGFNPPKPTYAAYDPGSNFVWQDTVTLPPGVVSSDGITIWPSKTTIRQTYLDFTGTYVLHCHILAHEDRGMMQLVRVVPADKYPVGCQFMAPQHH